MSAGRGCRASVGDQLNSLSQSNHPDREANKNGDAEGYDGNEDFPMTSPADCL